MRSRNVREWVAAALVAVLFGASGVAAPAGSARWSSWLLVATVVFVSVYIYAFGRPRLRAENRSDLRDAFRDELSRQASLLRSAPLWYATPLAGALFVRAVAQRSFVSAAIGVLLGVAVAWLNLKAAHDLKRRADALR